MRRTLKRLKLIQEVDAELKISKSKFIKELKNNVDEEEISFSAHLLEPFSSGFCKYKGRVGHKEFVIKKRSRLFDIGKNIAVVNGTCQQKGKSLFVSMEIDGFRRGMIIYYSFLTIFCVLYLASIFRSMASNQLTDASYVIIVTLLQMVFFFGMPYLIMRRSIRYIRNEFLRDLAILSK